MPTLGRRNPKADGPISPPKFFLSDSKVKTYQMRFFYDPQLSAFRRHCESQEPSLFASEQHFRSRNQFALNLMIQDNFT